MHCPLQDVSFKYVYASTRLMTRYAGFGEKKTVCILSVVQEPFRRPLPTLPRFISLAGSTSLIFPTCAILVACTLVVAYSSAFAKMAVLPHPVSVNRSIG